MTKLFFDMDGTLVDFQSGIDQIDDATKKKYEGHLDDVPGIFSLMKPIEGAIDAVRQLSCKYDCYILSTAPWKNPSAWSDKVAWVTKYFDEVFHKKIILTHNKDLLNDGKSLLIDDRPNHGAENFGDRWIHFGHDKFKTWEDVLTYLLSI